MALSKFISLILLTSSVVSGAKENISPLKKELLACFKEEFTGTKAQSLAKIYAEIEQKYQLQSTTLSAREVEFTENDESKKLRYLEQKLSLFRVLDDGSVKTIDNDLRQKERTIEATISQLLIHAKFQRDWTKTKEVRAGQRLLTIVRVDGEITSLIFAQELQKKQLFCTREVGPSGSRDICSCREPK